MSIEKILYEGIPSLIKKNPGFGWPERNETNRLEPVCQPLYTPSFKIKQDDKIFTLGSCFARNIENHMVGHGLDVIPTRINPHIPKKFALDQLRNLYSPVSILDGLKWALCPNEMPDPAECLIKTKKNEWFDPMLHPPRSGNFDEVIETNKLVRRNMTLISECRIIVITLGLVECVFDKKTGRYLNSIKTNIIQSDSYARYEIHIMDLDEVLNSLETIFDLLTKHLKNNFKIMLSVSPVPLKNTFRNMDVITANMYSKSLLRTAAEIFSSNHDNIDYLPIYESVVMSERKYTWESDLIHVSDFIIKLNIERALNLYTNGEFASASTEVKSIIDGIDEEFIAALPMQLKLSREMEAQYTVMLKLFPKLRQKISELENEMRENEAEYVSFRANYDRLQKINTDYLRQIVELQGLK